MINRYKSISECERKEKPWGYEVIWANPESKTYIGKILSIKPHHRLSLQYHEKKEETIYVMSGVLILWEGDDNTDYLHLPPGTVYHVKPNQIHRFGAGASSVMLMEVSTNYLNDVVRIEDDYKR